MVLIFLCNIMYLSTSLYLRLASCPFAVTSGLKSAGILMSYLFQPISHPKATVDNRVHSSRGPSETGLIIPVSAPFLAPSRAAHAAATVPAALGRSGMFRVSLPGPSVRHGEVA